MSWLLMYTEVILCGSILVTEVQSPNHNYHLVKI